MSETSMEQVIVDPGLRGSRVLAGDVGAAGPTSVCVVEALEDLRELPQGSFAIFGRAASTAASGYRLDVTLREAAEQRVVGLMLTGPSVPERVSATSTSLARKAGIVVVAGPPHRNLAQLAVAAQSAIDGSADQALRRADAVLAELRRAQAALEGGDTDALRDTASEALGMPIELRDALPGEPSAQVRVSGQTVATISSPAAHGHLAEAARLSLALTAAAMERSMEATIRNEEAPVRSRGAVLSELLVAEESHTPGLVARARRLGVPVDGWHRALLLQVTSDAPGFDFLQALGRFALRAVGASPHSWHLARAGDALALLQTWRQEPQQSAARAGADVARQILEATDGQFPHVRLRCGVGTPHRGVSGLRATVAEARAALAADAHRQVAAFDQAGLQTMLLEWYSTDTARQAVKALLEPLDRLGGERAQTAITTLQAYLDAQGSLQRAAERLHLHRNAIAYRMKQISAVLGSDLGDPEERLALQLACRARLFH